MGYRHARALAVSIAVNALAATLVAAAAPPVLAPVATIEMAGVKGRIDHLAFDPGSRRLFVAALGNGSLEVIDTNGGKRRTIAGLREPQGVVYAAAAARIFVAEGGADRVDVLDATSLEPLRRIERMPDADNERYVPAGRSVIVGYGRGALRFLDAASGESKGDLALPGHPEAFEAEPDGPRVFVNVPEARAIVVVDRVKGIELARWTVPGASANFPMALDPRHGRLFVGTRSPPELLAYDTASGRVVARVPIGGDVDDLFYDDARDRVYAICGAGRIDAIDVRSPDRYRLDGSTATAHGARTGLFVPESRTLYVAAPASRTAPARILVYRVR